MYLEDDESNVKRIIGSEPVVSSPLFSDEQSDKQSYEQAAQKTLDTKNTYTKNPAQNTAETSVQPENNPETALNDPQNTDTKTEQDTTQTISENIQTPKSETEEKFTPPAKAVQSQNGDDPEDNRMPLLSHLGELRVRLTRIVIMILIAFFGFYGIAEIAYTYLAEPLTRYLPEGSTLIYTSPQGAFFTYMKVALMLSILGTSPFSFYQIWAFIAPGLYKEEQRAVLPLAFFSAFFFLAGAAFCYFAVFPVAFKFFMGFTSDLIKPMISVEEYLSFALKLIIAFGLVFEMPLFAFFLAKLRLLTADGMKRYRKYAILIIFIVAAILTPPDVFSQCMMAIPMLLLYEVSIYIAKAAYPSKKELKKANQDETQKKQETAEQQTTAAVNAENTNPVNE